MSKTMENVLVADKNLALESNGDILLKTNNDQPNESKSPFTFTASATNLSSPATSAGFGFSSYANINPFEVTKSNSDTGNGKETRAGGFSSLTSSQKNSNPFSTAANISSNPFASFSDSKSNVWTTTTTFSPATSATIEKPLFSGAFSFKRGLESSTSSNDLNKDNVKETSKDSDTPTNPANKRQKSTDDTEDANEDEEAGGADFNPEEEVTIGVYGRIYQLPENVPVITGEEGEECTFTSRAKLYRLVRKAPKGDDSKNGSNATSPRESVISPTVTTSSTDADWSEVGIGPIKILKSIISTTKKGEKQIDLPAKETQENNVESVNESDDKENSKDVTELLKFRLVMRRESSRGGPGTKVLLNAAIKGYVTVAKISDKMFRMSCICPRDENSPELVPATFLFKTKTTAEADDLYEEIKSIVDHFNTVAL